MHARRIALAGSVVVLAASGSAWAFSGLPAGGQVNDDPGAGIDRSAGVSGEDPANADVAGGALVAGQPAVPWAIFRQGEPSGQKDQVFARSFANGAWTTRGRGTRDGHSSATPAFSGPLNFDQGQDAEAPSIDFAGAGRTVPWASWYENTPGAPFANDEIYASRFDDTGDGDEGKWLFGGQSRGPATGQGPVPVPSLNLRTEQDAENPSVAGDPAQDGPWVAWQEKTSSPVTGQDQIYVSRSELRGNCDGVTPAGVATGGHVQAIGGVCWQQTGIPRVGPGSEDPSLNVDPTRNAIQPDIAFTGPGDSVPWVVWTETGPGAVGAGHDTVFAAEGVADGANADGNVHWDAVGTGERGTLDTGGTGYGACRNTGADEAKCALNKDISSDADRPQVAAGTMTPGLATVPWVAWDESVAGIKQVFVARLVGSGAGALFQLANHGAPISAGANDASSPSIAFSGNTPYVSWRQDTGGGGARAFVGHFAGADDPAFVLDQSDTPLSPTAQAAVREPIASTCPATPPDQDGASCQGGAAGTPFFLFTSGSAPLGLFADAYGVVTPATAAATDVTTSGATLHATVVPGAASENVAFQYGTTTAYGQTTAAQPTGVGGGPVTLSTALSGLAPGTTIHYRAFATSDFESSAGLDAILTTASQAPPPPPAAPPAPVGTTSIGAAKVSGSTVTQSLSCHGIAGARCTLALKLTVVETLRSHKVIAVAARARKTTHKTVVVGSTTATLDAGAAKRVKLSLNATGKRLLAKHDPLKAKLAIVQTPADGHPTTLLTKTVTFHRPHKHKTTHHR